MTDGDVARGAVVPPLPITAQDFDRAHEEGSKSEPLWQITSAAYEGDCPSEIQAWA